MAKNGVQSSRRPKQWVREMLAELVGTYLLIMIGDSAVANYALNRKSSMDHFSVAFTFGIAGMLGIAASFPISGAHLNPAVSLGFAAVGRFPFAKLPHYFLGQYLGAFLAAATVYAVYYEAIVAYDGGARVPFSSVELYGGAGNASAYARLATGGVFSTYPAEHVSIAGTLVDQIVATFSLVLGALIITSPHAKLPNYLHPFMLGMLICGLVVGFGLNCGAALNPARDLSPRLFQLLAGYGLNAFKPIKWTYWLTAGIIGPHVGGILGAWIFDWVLFYSDDEEDECKRSPRKTNCQSSKSGCSGGSGSPRKNGTDLEMSKTTSPCEESSFLVHK